MPFVHIRLLGCNADSEHLNQLQEDVAHLVSTYLRKRKDLTAVLIEQDQASVWSVGGKQVSAAAHLEVVVTDGTNTHEEKALFISQANMLLAASFERKLPVATYVVIRETPATSWGYDGRTQADRKVYAAA